MKFREQSPGQLSTSTIPVGKRVNQAGVESNIIATIAKRNFVISYAADRRKNWSRTFIMPVSEGHACHARRRGMDYPTWRSGPDKRVPPKGELAGARSSFM